MKKKFLILFVIALIIAGTSAAFADDTARDAMIAYSGTETFAKLTPEERRACMFWVAEGGQMNEVCRAAATRLIAEEPDAVTPKQRHELFAATTGKISSSSTASHSKRRDDQPREKTTTVRKEDNSGAIITAGILGVVAGMIIHNNLPRHRGPSYRPGPPRPPRHPMPPRHHVPAPRPAPVPVRRQPNIYKAPPGYAHPTR